MRYFLTFFLPFLFTVSSFGQVVEDTTDFYSEKRRISTKIEYLKFEKMGETKIEQVCSDVVWINETWAIRLVFVSKKQVLLEEDHFFFIIDGEQYKRRVVYIDQHKKGDFHYYLIGTLFEKDDRFYRKLKSATEIKIEIGDYVILANKIVDQEIDSILKQLEKTDQ